MAEKLMKECPYARVVSLENLNKGETLDYRKLWMARLTIRDGEFEYGEDVFIKNAEDIDKANARAVQYVKTFFDDEEAVPVDGADGWYEEKYGYRWIKVASVRQILNFDALISTLEFA